MSIPYRTQQGFKRFFIALLIIMLVAALLLMFWLVWLGRFVVYTREGAVLDMSRSSKEISGQLAVPPQDTGSIEIYYNEGDDAISTGTELTQLTGYYISAQALKGDMEVIKEQIRQLPAGTPVMVEVKNSFGSFYYSTGVSEFITDEIDPLAMDELIKFLDQSGMYTIARLPALRDYCYGLNHTRDGLPHPGGYLWADADYRYWLNAGSEGTISFLTAIAKELQELGFDEVVFFEFCFPENANIVFNGDREQTINNAAQTLVNTCATATFAVSFEGSEGFKPPIGRSRVFYESVDAIDAEDVAEASGVSDTAVNLVFVTDTHDTRFDVYGVMRPIEAAH